MKTRDMDQPPTFKEFKRYCLWWAKLFHIPRHLLTIENMGSDEPDGRWADATTYPNYGSHRIRSFPSLFEQSVEDVWGTACHECIHLVLNPYVGWTQRFGELERLPNAKLMSDEERERLELVVNSLEASLTKRLTVRELSGTMKPNSRTTSSTEHGGTEHVRLISSLDREPSLPTEDCGGSPVRRVS